MSTATDTTDPFGMPTPEAPTHRERILAQVAAMRALCDFAEENVSGFPDYVLAHDFATFVDTAEEMARLATTLGGQWQKRATDSLYCLERDFGGTEYSRVKLSINTMRANVCERVQTGTETVMEPDPELVAEIPLVPVEKPVYEWKCPDSLLDIRGEDFTGPLSPETDARPF